MDDTNQALKGIKDQNVGNGFGGGVKVKENEEDDGGVCTRTYQQPSSRYLPQP